MTLTRFHKCNLPCLTALYSNVVTVHLSGDASFSGYRGAAGGGGVVRADCVLAELCFNFFQLRSFVIRIGIFKLLSVRVSREFLC